MKLFAIIVCLILSGQVMADVPTDMRPFFDALRQVETGGEPNGGRDAVGDGGASIGPYQIQKAYWIDSGVDGEYEQVRDREYAEKVMLAYWKRYNRQALNDRNWEALARIHVGGPKGHQRNATIPYWNKVKKVFHKAD